MRVGGVSGACNLRGLEDAVKVCAWSFEWIGLGAPCWSEERVKVDVEVVVCGCTAFSGFGGFDLLGLEAVR